MNPRVLPDLWDRLARLNECCDISTTNVQVPSDSGRERALWAVVIRRRDDPALFVQAHGEGLGECLSAAVLQAAERGWPGSLSARDGSAPLGHPRKHPSR